jgi:hypothetical protein
MRRTLDLFMEALHQARFADPRLADQRHLPFTLEDAFPAIQQQAQFVPAADERGQSTRRRRGLEPPASLLLVSRTDKLRSPLPVGPGREGRFGVGLRLREKLHRKCNSPRPTATPW